MKRGYTQKQAVLILYGLTATLGMFAVILFESGIWKALSFALLLVGIVGIAYKEIFRLKEKEEGAEQNETYDENNVRHDKS